MRIYFIGLLCQWESVINYYYYHYLSLIRCITDTHTHTLERGALKIDTYINRPIELLFHIVCLYTDF